MVIPVINLTHKRCLLTNYLKQLLNRTVVRRHCLYSTIDGTKQLFAKNFGEKKWTFSPHRQRRPVCVKHDA